jgi:hypothetical protein
MVIVAVNRMSEMIEIPQILESRRVGVVRGLSLFVTAISSC